MIGGTRDKLDHAIDLVRLINMAGADLDHEDQRLAIRTITDLLEDMLKEINEDLGPGKESGSNSQSAKNPLGTLATNLTD